MQAREYPFLDSDVPGIFDDLLEANLIDLPEMKQPEETKRKDDRKYCKYHRLVGHAIQDCFVFKDKVMQLARQDAKTSYNMLLGRPWSHENAVVPSTWHQCFKYCRNDIVKKGFVPSTQEEERGYEALAIDEKGFDPKAFKLLIKVGYDPKEKLNLRKLPPEATGKKLHGFNATHIMLKEKGHAIQDSRVGLGFTPPKRVRITIKRVNSNYISEGFSSTEDHKREENLRESIFNRLDPHRKELHEIANRIRL
ncbi:UNVERIFIED_CONTAM: hypothetical protein Sangu_3036000 [Sesamum angustifolium]|uniref:G-patch domain-containing protein n=1 Tax=Sesamum angustifolium TaxID=2727405 RepID=A0AAW2KFY6_9LAMI